MRSSASRTPAGGRRRGGGRAPRVAAPLGPARVRRRAERRRGPGAPRVRRHLLVVPRDARAPREAPVKVRGDRPPRRGARGPTSSRTLRGAPPLKRRTTRPSAPRRRPRRCASGRPPPRLGPPSSSTRRRRPRRWRGALATLAAAPTASVVVRGRAGRRAGVDAAAADPAVLADVHAECARYGAVERVALAAGDVVVDFALVDDAVACLAALKFRSVVTRRPG